MRLNKLKILGFKSFADEVELEFMPGLTAIVGPNGCGKSNISDAIRWVLGEQNARFLRGKEMGDIIFNGTASRKPLGMAEINLEMSNLGSIPLAYQQIQITRRLFRSGESEYLLNKKICRLKDITDLFLEWGINKRAYTTIEQGNIDFIINAKPHERRILVETAAGILKYKERKRETIQKLELTKGNIDRIQDIKKEVETQRKSLQKQARQARLYKNICQQTDEKERRCIILRYKILMFHLEQAQYDYQKLSDHEQSIVAKLRSQESELEKSRLESMHLGTDFERLQKELWEKEVEKRQLEKRLESLIQEKTLREETLVRLAREKDLLDAKEVVNQKTLQDLHSNLIRFEAELLTREKKQKEIEEEKVRSQKQIHMIKDQLEKKKRNLTTLNTMVSVTQNNLSHLKAKENGIKRGISEQAAREKELLEDEKRIKNEMALIQEKREELLSHIKAIEITHKKMEEESNNLSKLLKDLALKIEKQRELCAELRHRKAHLQELESKMEGFHSSVQHLLKMFSNRKTISQILSTEKQYENALESVLGDNLQYILVETKEESLELIKELRAGQKGKATFIPITIIKEDGAGEVGPDIKTHPGFVGRLIDLINFHEKYKGLFCWLLGDILVVNNLQTAMIMHQNQSERWSFVTLDGDIIKSKGIVTGGGMETGSLGILSRKRELEELKEKAIIEESQLKSLLKDQENFKKNSINLDQRIAGIKAEISEKESKMRDLGQEYKYFDKEKEAMEKGKGKIVQDKKQSEKDLIKVQQSIFNEKEKEENLNKELAHIREGIRLLEGKWEIAKKIQSTINHTYMEEGMALVSLKERIIALNREKKGSEDTYKEREKDFIRIEEEIKGINKRIAVIEQEIAQVNESLPEYSNKAIKQHQDLERIRDLFNKAKERGIEYEDALRSTRQDLEQSRKQIKSKEIEVAEWRTRLDDLQQDFPSMPEEAASQDNIVHFESELEDVKRQLEKLKEKMQNFGSVNLSAIEAFEEVNERYQFLNHQISDLQKAHESLMAIIKEINSTSRELFQEAFYKIRENFQHIFTRLFNGGQAELHLQEGVDCLEAGIHIVSQPPGKRLQRIDLLSGGEKALTALALILAVYQLKPSPFCILDEVDAPLDETNVDRFIKLIQEMKERTQFIIITHCKRTMMKVDSIYGITMQTPGVSKVVSVRIDQAQGFYADAMPKKKEFQGGIQIGGL